MQENWYSIKNFDKSNCEEIKAEIITDNNSPWFSGHFPDDPILPGIALVSFIYDLIAKSLEIEEKNMPNFNLKRIRFRKIIRPGDLLNIEIKKTQKRNLYNFKLFSEKELACSGSLKFKD